MVPGRGYDDTHSHTAMPASTAAVVPASPQPPYTHSKAPRLIAIKLSSSHWQWKSVLEQPIAAPAASIHADLEGVLVKFSLNKIIIDKTLTAHAGKADVDASHCDGSPKVAVGVTVGVGVTGGGVTSGTEVVAGGGVAVGEGYDEAQLHTSLAAAMTAPALPIPHSSKTQLRAALLILE